jgi:SPP1 family predicted phage head-tail adaptor
MKIGPMRQRVTVQTLSESADSYGQMIKSWTDAGSFYAEVRNLSGREAVNARQIKPEVTHQVRMRYVGQLFASPGLLPSMRLLFGAAQFNILWVNDVDNRHREYRLLVQEIVNTTQS